MLAVENHTQAWTYIFQCLQIDIENKKAIDKDDLLILNLKL